VRAPTSVCITDGESDSEESVVRELSCTGSLLTDSSAMPLRSRRMVKHAELTCLVASEDSSDEKLRLASQMGREAKDGGGSAPRRGGVGATASTLTHLPCPNGMLHIQGGFYCG
jgi:hypothetical protein